MEEGWCYCSRARVRDRKESKLGHMDVIEAGMHGACVGVETGRASRGGVSEQARDAASGPWMQGAENGQGDGNRASTAAECAWGWEAPSQEHSPWGSD